MSTPIEALAQEKKRLSHEYPDAVKMIGLERARYAQGHDHGFDSGYEAGYKAASGQGEALAIAVEALEKYKDMVYIYGGSYTPKQSFAAKTALEKIKALSGAGKGEG